MAFSHGTPNSIVTDGLVFCVDPANKVSYPGSGTICNDLIGTTNGTLQSTGMFETNDAGVFDFDGGTNYISFPQFNFTSTHTIEFWMNTTDLSDVGFGNAGTPFAWGYAPSVRFLLQPNGTIRYYLYGTAGASYYTSGTISINNWFQITLTINWNTSTANMYINGIKDSSSPQSITDSGNWVYNGASNTYDFIDFGKNVSNNNLFYTGNLSSTKIYNRVLDENEVTQNYNALKNRFRT
jgi:hypothetical protein